MCSTAPGGRITDPRRRRQLNHDGRRVSCWRRPGRLRVGGVPSAVDPPTGEADPGLSARWSTPPSDRPCAEARVRLGLPGSMVGGTVSQTVLRVVWGSRSRSAPAGGQRPRVATVAGARGSMRATTTADVRQCGFDSFGSFRPAAGAARREGPSPDDYAGERGCWPGCTPTEGWSLWFPALRIQLRPEERAGGRPLWRNPIRKLDRVTFTRELSARLSVPTYSAVGSLTHTFQAPSTLAYLY
jgi:hypothetical protein